VATDMTKGKPIKLLIGFALPLMIGNIFQQFYNLVDTVIVGRFIGPDALAAVGTTGNIIAVTNSLMMGLSVGAGIVVAQYYGIHNQEKLKNSIVALIELVSVLTAIIPVLGFLLAPTILHLMQVPDNIIGNSIMFLRICMAGMFGMIVYNGAASILRSVGDSKTPLLAMVVSSLVNIALNLLFVLQFNMGVAGAAYGTVIAQVVAAAICIRQLYIGRIKIGLTQLDFTPQWHMIMIVVKAGVPFAVQSSLISLGGMSVQGLVNTFGMETMSAYAAVQRIDSVTIQIVVAIGSALSVFTGQNIGSKNFERIREALHKTLMMMMICCVSLAVIVLCFKKQILSIFLDPAVAADAIRIGSDYMTIIVIAYIIAGVMNSYLNLIRGAGDVNASFLAGVAEITGRIVFAYLLVKPFGVTGIWIATPLSWGCGCLYSVYRYYSGKWKKQWII